jgi:Mg-chelatase subunit ChlD
MARRDPRIVSHARLSWISARSAGWAAVAVLGLACSGGGKAGSGGSPHGAAAVSGSSDASSANAGAGDFGNPSSPPDNPQDMPGADAGEMDCGRQTFDVARRPADILLVLDRSGSMKDDVNGDSKAPSKWDLVVPALQEVISATDATVDWGLKLFPRGDDAGECSADSYPSDIAVEIKATNASAVNQAISSATPKGDGTPTSDAVDEAVKYLKTIKDGNPKYILLATDGEPSCAGTTKSSSKARTAAIAGVKAAADADFHTFVVGIATTKSSASDTLTELASAGLEAPSGSGYYLASTKDELVSAVQKIAGSVGTCLFPLNAKPPNPDHVGVTIGDDRVAHDANNVNGWNYVDSDMMAIKLFGAACDEVMSRGVDSVKVVFGCKADVLF